MLNIMININNNFLIYKNGRIIKYYCYKIILVKYYLPSKIIIFHLIKLFTI